MSIGGRPSSIRRRRRCGRRSRSETIEAPTIYSHRRHAGADHLGAGIGECPRSRATYADAAPGPGDERGLARQVETHARTIDEHLDVRGPGRELLEDFGQTIERLDARDQTVEWLAIASHQLDRPLVVLRLVDARAAHLELLPEEVEEPNRLGSG